MEVSSKVLATLFSVATVVSLVGCSGSATTTAGSPVMPMVTSSPLPPLPPPPPPTGSVGGIDVTIAAEDSAPLLRPGGGPVAFTVTLTNTTPADIPEVGMVVSFGHCSCGYPGASMMPAGSMRLLDPDSKAWVAVPYVAEGTGTDYLNATLVPPFVLKQGQTITYQLEAQLDANPDVTAGTSLMTVTIKTPAGGGQAASLPVTVEP